MYRKHIVTILASLFMVGILTSKAQQNYFKETGYYAYLNNAWVKISEEEACSGKYTSARHVKVEQTKDGIIYSVTGITPKKNTEKKNIVLSIFPNPAQNSIQVKTNEPLKKAILNIYDMTGKLLLTISYTNNQKINVGSLKNGAYIMRLIDDKNQFTERLIISR